MDGASPLDTSGSKCQNYYLALPSGWALAADNADSLYVIRSYRWGTYGLVVANGYAYLTASQGSSAGSLSTTSGALYTSGSTYKINNCNHLILISKTGSLPCTACPAGESRDSGARVREAYVCEFGEDRVLHQKYRQRAYNAADLIKPRVIPQSDACRCTRLIHATFLWRSRAGTKASAPTDPCHWCAGKYSNIAGASTASVCTDCGAGES